MDTNQCYCCLLRPAVKELQTPYIHLGITEIYSDMLKECFEIHLKLDYDDECGICLVCVGRLRDASDFKLQVQRSQAELRERLVATMHDYSIVEESSVKPELLGDVAEGAVLYHDIKSEMAEPAPSDAGERNHTGIDLKIDNEDDVKNEYEEMPFTNPFVELERPNCDEKQSVEFHDLSILTHMDVSGDDVNYEELDDIKNFLETCTEPSTCDKKQSLKTRVDKTAAMWTLPCRICSESFFSCDHFDRHMINHTREKLYACDLCKRQCSQKKSLIMHIEAIHTGIKRCEICKKTFFNKSALKRHKLTHTEELECKECNLQFVTKTERRAHKRIHVKNKRYNCIVCDLPFPSRSLVNKHFELFHKTAKPYACEVCSRSYRRKGALKNHKCSHDKTKPYCCETCKKNFASVSSLNEHKITHVKSENRRKYFCELCGSRFVRIQGLDRHIQRTHTGEKPYSCDTCNKRFYTKSEIRSHILNVHMGLKPYSCDVCARKFSQKGHLWRHKLIHTVGGPTFPCDVCNKQFRYKFKLKAHRLIHTGEKPYACETCGKCFNKQYTLKTHLETHVKGRTFTCELCPKYYSTKEGLRQHKRVHLKNKVAKSIKSEVIN